MSSIYDIALTTIDGKSVKLKDYQGKAVLVVNVASKCGLTPQYKQLEALYQQYQAKGLVVLGFPSNEFAGQEPGSEAEIQTFCEANYGVTFPMFSKISVNGDERHELYQALIAAQPKCQSLTNSPLKAKLEEHGLLAGRIESDVMWNFEKFLISPSGEVVGRFAPDMTVDNDTVAAAIEKQLAS